MSSGSNNGRRIVCAANMIVWNGETHTFLGARHFDVRMREQIFKFLNTSEFENADQEREFMNNQEQGFIDTWGVFHNRKEAYKIAKYHNQIIHDIGYETDELFTEHLY